MNDHNHPQKKQVINRMSKIVGHAQSIKTMCEDGRDCTEILNQIAAVKSALNSVGKVILKDHISHCILDACKNNDLDAIDNLNKTIDKLL